MKALQQSFTVQNEPATIGQKNSRHKSLVLTSSRDEMNLVEFPLAVLSTRVNATVKTLEFFDTQRLPNGDKLERKWILTGADKFGLPTSTDDDVVLGLICLTMDQGFRDRKVRFTRYELLKILRWSTEGKSYSRLTKSLDRLSGVRIRATDSFYDNSLKAYQTRNFGIIDAYEINDERGARNTPNSFFIWSEVMFDSFKAGFIKKINLDFYFTLKSAVSRRLYRYLDKHFYYRHTVEKPLTVLAFEKLGLSRNYKYVSSIKQQITPACKELVKSGYLESYEFGARGSTVTAKFVKTSKDRVTPSSESLSVIEDIEAGTATGVVYETISNAPKTKAKDHTEKLSDKLILQLEELLVHRGLTRSQGRKLLEKRSSAELQHIKSILRYFDHLVKTSDQRVSINPVGFLYRAVESPYRFAVPEEFQKGKAASANSQRKRPERQIHKAEKSQSGNGHMSNSISDDLSRCQYDEYVNGALIQYTNKLGNEVLDRITHDVESRMSCLKSVLDSQKYAEARQGLVRAELIKSAGLPEFEVWQSRSQSQYSRG